MRAGQMWPKVVVEMHISRQKHHKIIAIVYKCSDTKLEPESILSMVILKY